MSYRLWNLSLIAGRELGGCHECSHVAYKILKPLGKGSSHLEPEGCDDDLEIRIKGNKDNVRSNYSTCLSAE